MKRLWQVVSAVSSLLLLVVGLVCCVVPAWAFLANEGNASTSCCAIFFVVPGVALAWVGVEGLRALRPPRAANAE